MSARAVSRVVLTSFVIAAIGLCTGLIAARVLGPEDRGYLGLIVFWPSFAIAFFKPPYADAIVVHSGLKLQPPSIVRAMAFRCASVAIAMSIPICGVAILLVTAEYAPLVVFLTFAFAGALLLSSHVGEIFLGIARAGERFEIVNLMRLFVPVGYLILMLAAAAINLGLPGFVLAHIVALLLSLGFGWVVLPGRTRQSEGNVAIDYIPFLRTALAFHGAGLAAMLSGQIDRLFLFPSSSPETIGIYLVALAVASPVQGLFGGALANVALPVLSNARAGDRSNAALRMLRLSVVASLIGTVAIALLAPLVVPILFGREFASAGPLASAIAIASAPALLRQAFAPIFKAERSSRTIIASEFVFVCVFAVGYGLATLAGFRWPVVYAIGGANVATIVYLAVQFHRLCPGSQLAAWAVPTPTSVLELIQVGLAGLPGVRWKKSR